MGQGQGRDRFKWPALVGLADRAGAGQLVAVICGRFRLVMLLRMKICRLWLEKIHVAALTCDGGLSGGGC